MPEKDSGLLEFSVQERGDDKNLRSRNDVRRHTHDGTNSEQISIRTLSGFIQTVAAVPAWTPRNLFEQVAIYKSGATIRLYIYDSANNAWRYATLA